MENKNLNKFEVSVGLSAAMPAISSQPTHGMNSGLSPGMSALSDHPGKTGFFTP